MRLNYSLQLLIVACVVSISNLCKEEVYGWFGSGIKRTDDTRIIPFMINVSDESIQDLKFRLKNARINHEPLEDSNDFSYGFNGNYLKYLVDYWLKYYNWKYYEYLMNLFPQFITEIEGLKVHFIHAKPTNSKYKVIIPLLILHGWPGTVFELYKVIPMLLDPAERIDSDIEIAFEVIAPSIPGFGWSSAPMKKGFHPVAAARIFNKLMNRLGFPKYLAQGGDWGSHIATALAAHFPRNVIGLHLNMATVSNWKVLVYGTLGLMAPSILSSEIFPNGSAGAFLKIAIEETGYMHIQVTKPDTVGAALSDSPVGLAAYILEKFSSGTDLRFRSLPDGGLTKKFTLDELLTIASIHWFNGNMVNAMRLYKEYFQYSMHLVRKYINVPTGYAVFPHEVIKQPEEVMRTMYNLTSYTETSAGGHFAALEEPKILATDIIKFVKTIQIQ